jgi:hypothetical protein
MRNHITLQQIDGDPVRSVPYVAGGSPSFCWSGTPAEQAANKARIGARWEAQAAYAAAPLLASNNPLIHAHISPSIRVVGETSPVKSTLEQFDSRLYGSVEVWLDGSLLKVRKPKEEMTHTGGGLRGAVVGFSKASRRRLIQKLAELDRDARPLFVTLTYPKEFPVEAALWKKHFDNWVKRLHRRYPGAGLVWRLEPQKRGAPHFHILLFCCGVSGGEFRLWAGKSWFACVGSGDPKHLVHGVDVRTCANVRMVRAYVGKYLAKVQAPPVQTDDDGVVLESSVNWLLVGRWWGVRYSQNLPFSRVVGSRSLTPSQVHNLMLCLRRYLKGQGVRVNSQMPSMTVLVNNPVQWYGNLYELSNRVATLSPGGQEFFSKGMVRLQ